MKVIDVEKIRFAFGESWTVAEKWDDSRLFLDGICRLNGELRDEQTGAPIGVGTKAVDIVGVRDDRLYLIEVKDYRGHAIETKERQRSELPLAIACKVRDTVAGLIGASRKSAEPWVDRCTRLLVEQKRRVVVMAWIADPAPRPAEPTSKREVWQKVRSDRTKRLLSWLTPHVSVATPFEHGAHDVIAQNLPGATVR